MAGHIPRGKREPRHHYPAHQGKEVCCGAVPLYVTDEGRHILHADPAHGCKQYQGSGEETHVRQRLGPGTKESTLSGLKAIKPPFHGAVDRTGRAQDLSKGITNSGLEILRASRRVDFSPELMHQIQLKTLSCGPEASESMHGSLDLIAPSGDEPAISLEDPFPATNLSSGVQLLDFPAQEIAERGKQESETGSEQSEEVAGEGVESAVGRQIQALGDIDLIGEQRIGPSFQPYQPHQH
jgi:hypothetical protein